MIIFFRRGVVSNKGICCGVSGLLRQRPTCPAMISLIYPLAHAKGYISIALYTHTYIYPLPIGNIEETMKQFKYNKKQLAYIRKHNKNIDDTISGDMMRDGGI